jgi:hypothetical protein
MLLVSLFQSARVSGASAFAIRTIWVASEHDLDFSDGLALDPCRNSRTQVVENFSADVARFSSSSRSSRGSCNIPKQQCARVLVILQPFENPNNPFPMDVGSEPT